VQSVLAGDAEVPETFHAAAGPSYARSLTFRWQNGFATMRIATRLLWGLLTLGMVGLALWTLLMPGRGGPSTHFRNLDRDHTGTVSFEEWKAYYESRLAWPSSEWDFHFQDCDKDGQLTWREYARRPTPSGFCGGSYEAAMAGMPRRPMPENSWSQCVTDPHTGVQSCSVGSGTLSDFPPPDTPMQVLLDEPVTIPVKPLQRTR
jgi:hypothetical protein